MSHFPTSQELTVRHMLLQVISEEFCQLIGTSLMNIMLVPVYHPTNSERLSLVSCVANKNASQFDEQDRVRVSTPWQPFSCVSSRWLFDTNECPACIPRIFSCHNLRIIVRIVDRIGIARLDKNSFRHHLHSVCAQIVQTENRNTNMKIRTYQQLSRSDRCPNA